MKTPRIEEIVADLHSSIVGCVYGMNLDIKGKEAKRLYAELGNSMLLRKQLTQALTETKQAGIDEVVEKMGTLVERKFPRGERLWCIQCAKRLSQALQDKK